MYRGTSLSTQFHDKIMIRGGYQGIGHPDAFKVLWTTNAHHDRNGRLLDSV